MCLGFCLFLLSLEFIQDGRVSKTTKHKALWEKQLNTLREICKRKGWTLEESKNLKGVDCAYPAKDKITLVLRPNIETSFYILLHEMGHMFLCDDLVTYETRFDSVFDHFTCGSLTYQMKCVEEEMEAWRLGFDLARQYNLFVDLKKFETIKAKSLVTYLTWLADKRNKRRKDNDA